MIGGLIENRREVNKLIVTRIISKSRREDKMEVIGKDADGLQTLHICKKHRVWSYCAGRGMEEKKFFLPINMGGKG